VTTDPPRSGEQPDPAQERAGGPEVVDDQAGADRQEPPGHAQPTRRRRTRRRAERGGTNPSAEDLPDVVAPREEPKPGESQHDRWLREQRPPHWE
jgi:hypothetical protein